jgi:hypothetical protein
MKLHLKNSFATKALRHEGLICVLTLAPWCLAKTNSIEVSFSIRQVAFLVSGCARMKLYSSHGARIRATTNNTP